MIRAATLTGLLVTLLAAHADASDILQLKDGRIIDGVPMKVDGGDVVLQYENGEVRVAAARIEDYVIDGRPPPPADGDSDEAKEKRAKGLVPYQGKWITPERRQQFIEKAVAEKRAEIEDIRAHSEWRNRYQFETKNFVYESTLPPTLNDAHAEMLEAYFETFKKEWGIKVPKDWGKLTVCFYSSQDEFHRTGGAGGGTLAYYRFVAPRELNCYYDRRDPEASLSYMFHEANHYLTDLMDEEFQYPHWVNEAMAEYWGASVWDPEKKQWRVGEIQQGRLVELQNDLAAGKRLGLAELIDSDADYRHYYWGWSFVHFMLETPKYSKGFKKFFVDLARARDVDRKDAGRGFKTVTGEECLRVFEKRLKVKDLNALQEEWYAYIEGLETTGTRGLERAGLDSYYRGRRLRATRLLEEAIEAGSQNVLVHLRYADLLRLSPETQQKAVEMNRKACELDPLDANTWAELGFTLYALGLEGDGKKHVALAREMNPDDPYLSIEIAEALERHAERNK